MRLALAFMTVLALSLPASAQTPAQAPAPAQAKRQLFTAKDYETYFSEGDFRIESPTYRIVATEQVRRTAGGLAITTIEAGANADRSSPYPFEKRKSNRTRKPGTFDAKLKVLVYQRTDAEVQMQIASEIWLSKDKRTSISAGDVHIGSLGDSIRADAKADGLDPDKALAQYRRTVAGKWTLRCEFVDAPTHEVECLQTNETMKYGIVRRYRKQAGMS